ncbi:uncharacterized protein LOC132701445 [Cylas formicarius]|uniref:uncharacterized protein LOC132701445 n=1 Tax=Cylas formicarius TaxID=197179 RepID=UPI002958973D|nr:uncharacterized protein LOC132701445 [Cylas formicarius]
MKSDSVVELRRLLSTFSENLAAIDKFDIDLWDFTKFNLLLEKLDSTLKTRFELKFCDKDIPTFQDLCDFLEQNCKALENSLVTSRGITPTKRLDVSKRVSTDTRRPTSMIATSTPPSADVSCTSKCLYYHPLTECDSFLSLEPPQRHVFIKQHRLCFNCFARSHGVGRCPSKINCRVCGKRHHTLVHFGNATTPSPSNETPPAPGNQEGTIPSPVTMMTNLSSQKVVLFATCLVSVSDKSGRLVTYRALLDSASQASFVTDSFAKKLELPRSLSPTPIQALNQMSTSALGKVALSVTPSQRKSPALHIEALVIPSICDKVPYHVIDKQNLKHLRSLPLADPHFCEPNEIDVLLGAEVYGDICLPGFRKGQNGGPGAFRTIFGWVVLGKVNFLEPSSPFSFYTTVSTAVDVSLKRFWELESVPSKTFMSPEGKLCEEIFLSTHSRAPSGRYVVSLPFKDKHPSLGESYPQALRRFQLLEARLAKNPTLRLDYNEFLRDY